MQILCGASFFLFFLPQFSPIEKTIYLPKDFILEIGSGRIKRGESRHVTSRHVTFLDPISGFFFSRVSRSVPFSKKKDPRRGGGPKTVI